MSSDNTQSKVRSRGPIAAILANARQEINGQPFAPSLDNPSRPKTPAGFDEKMANPSLGIMNMRTSAGNRSREAMSNSSQAHNYIRQAASRQQLLQPKREVNQIEREVPRISSRTSVPIVSSMILPLNKIVESGFSAEKLRELQDDLTDVNNHLETEGLLTLDATFIERIELFIKFLQSLQSDADLSYELVNQIEGIVMVVSGIAMYVAKDFKASQAFEILRLTVRMLVPLFETCCKSQEDTFEPIFVGGIMLQCAHMLKQLCGENYVPDEAGNMTLQLASLSATTQDFTPQTSRSDENIYQSLDEDCDIEEEDGDGQYVPVVRATSATSKLSATVPQTNGDITACAQWIQLLQLLWPYVTKLTHNIVRTREETADNTSALKALVQTASYVAMIYKMIAADETGCKWLNSAGALQVLQAGLLFFQEPATTRYMQKIASPVMATLFADCLTQLLSVVRGFGEVKSCRNALFEQRITPKLCILFGTYQAHPMVVVNCARVLARLSLFESGRNQINESETHIQNLVRVVLREAQQSGGGGDGQTEWPSQHTWPILTRVCYTLGHLTTTNAKNRRLIGTIGLTGVSDKDDPLVDLLSSCGLALSSMFGGDEEDSDEYASDDQDGYDSDASPSAHKDHKHPQDRPPRTRAPRADLSMDQPDNEPEEDSRSAEKELVDATIKLVRLMANLSIDPSIGEVLGSKNPNALEMLVKMLLSVKDGSGAGQEELLLNVIAACTNLTYYSSQFINRNTTASTPGSVRKPSTADKMLELSLQLTTVLVELLTRQPGKVSPEIQLEAARVLGNLTRIESVRRDLLQKFHGDFLLDLLRRRQEDQWEIVTAATGVLVNLSADGECKALLLTSSKVLVELSWLLPAAGLQDLDLSTLVCQALYNLLLDCSASTCADPEHHNRFLDRLHNTLKRLVGECMDYAEESGASDGANFLKVGVAVMKLIAKQRE